MDPTVRFVRLAPGQRKFRILVVDDHFSNRDSLLLMLADMGFYPREAINGKEAVAIFQQWHPDVILMDVMMPEMDGREATRCIKASPGAEATAVVIIAPDTMDVDAKWAREAGADGFLRKPLSDTQLAELLHDVCGIGFVMAQDDAMRVENGTLPSRISREPVLDIPEDVFLELQKAVRDRNMARLMNLVFRCAESDPNVEKVLLELLKQDRFIYYRELF